MLVQRFYLGFKLVTEYQNGEKITEKLLVECVLAFSV